MRRIQVLGAFNAFKDSLSAESVTITCLNKLKELYPDKIETKSLPLSDGGDGFLESLKKPLQLDIRKTVVTGPLGNKIEAEWGRSRDSPIGVIEMATASGLHLVPEDKRNPLHTTSRGTGELVMEAVRDGCKRIIMGVGGSATNDGGLGALQAMGLIIHLSSPGQPPYQPDIFFGRHLSQLESLELPREPLLPGISISIACDVNSPFVGPKGATMKGASKVDREELEKGMRKASQLFRSIKNVTIDDLPGSGAAGGIAGGFVGIMGAELKKGVELVVEAHSLEQILQESDLILTGEGIYDSTSEAGKVPYQVIQMAKKHSKPVVVICGKKKDILDKEVPVFELLSMYPLEESMRHTERCLEGLLAKHSSSFPVLSTLQNKL